MNNNPNIVNPNILDENAPTYLTREQLRTMLEEYVLLVSDYLIHEPATLSGITPEQLQTLKNEWEKHANIYLEELSDIKSKIPNEPQNAADLNRKADLYIRIYNLCCRYVGIIKEEMQWRQMPTPTQPVEDLIQQEALIPSQTIPQAIQPPAGQYNTHVQHTGGSNVEDDLFANSIFYGGIPQQSAQQPIFPPTQHPQQTEPMNPYYNQQPGGLAPAPSHPLQAPVLPGFQHPMNPYLSQQEEFAGALGVPPHQIPYPHQPVGLARGYHQANPYSNQLAGIPSNLLQMDPGLGGQVQEVPGLAQGSHQIRRGDWPGENQHTGQGGRNQNTRYNDGFVAKTERRKSPEHRGGI